MSAKPEVEEVVKVPGKSKKLLILIGAGVLILALVGGGAAFFISKQRAAAAAEEGDAGQESSKSVSTEPKSPPVYLPLDSMVVNLADPGGEKVAQVGVTLEVADAHAVDTVKAYLPTIRSGILLLISQRTSEELLKSEGKERLAKDILRETLIPFGGGDSHAERPVADKKAKTKAKDAHSDMPVVRVLFSSFIIQ